jgi:putative transcription factor
MRCEMCGKETDLVKAIIESAEMDVCVNCAKHGTVLRRISMGSMRRSIEPPKPQKEIIEEVREDYAEIIRKAREDTKLSQEEFALKISEKESLIHKIETGGLLPSLKLARKLERILHIKLVEVIEEHHNAGAEKKKSDELTLGDVIKIKNR